MKTKLCDVNASAIEKLPQKTDDKSGIGVHYVDAYVKPMNVKLPDGTAVKCKRRGLKITLTVGSKKGDGLMRRLDVSADPIVRSLPSLSRLPHRQQRAPMSLGGSFSSVPQ